MLLQGIKREIIGNKVLHVGSDGKKFVVGVSQNAAENWAESMETICNFRDMTNFTPPGKSY